MSQATLRSKLVLPTIDSCRHRNATVGGSEARCELLREITAVFNESPCHVSREACTACCESFPSTVTEWNPVIASLIYDLAGQVLLRDEDQGNSAHEAKRFQALATEVLEVATLPTSFRSPARDRQSCCYLGERIASGAEIPAVESNHAAEPFHCGHPAHGTTTLAHCRRCRDWSAAPLISRRLSLPELVPPAPTTSRNKIHQWAVGITTSHRREPTLGSCVDSVVRAGWVAPHLFVDGVMPIPAHCQHLPITWRENPVGAWPNYYLALAELTQLKPDADAYLMLQDDSVLYDGGDLLQYLEAALWPTEQLGLVSLYCPQSYTVVKPGWHALRWPWVWGANAFLFPRQLAREFISNPGVIAHRWQGLYGGRAQVDVLIGQWAADRGYPIHYPCPSLVQHIGNTSTIWRNATVGGTRRSDWFAGDLESPFQSGENLSDFPEHAFPCRAEHLEEYTHRVETGRKRMSARRVVISALCRNVRHFLPRTAVRMERIGQQFADYRIVLYENDSSDATVEFLRDWQRQNARVHVISEQLGRVHYPSVRSAERVVRLAEYRNRCRHYALERFSDFDNVLVLDSDLPGGWSYDGLANTFGHDGWDFVGSSGLLRSNSAEGSRWLQYDAWAFRALGHPGAHPDHEINHTVFERGEPLLQVLSCFGGMGAYSMEAIKSSQYGGQDNEHAVLHARMRSKGFHRQYLNPSQIALYSPW